MRLATVLLLTATLFAQTRPVANNALVTSMDRKLQHIQENGRLARPDQRPTVLTEAETNVTRDGISFDVNINARFRKQFVDGDPKTLQDIYFCTSFPCLADHPVVLNVSSVPGREGTFVVVTARVRFANADGKRSGGAVASPQK